MRRVASNGNGTDILDMAHDNLFMYKRIHFSKKTHTFYINHDSANFGIKFVWAIFKKNDGVMRAWKFRNSLYHQLRKE